MSEYIRTMSFKTLRAFMDELVEEQGSLMKLKKMYKREYNKQQKILLKTERIGLKELKKVNLALKKTTKKIFDLELKLLDVNYQLWKLTIQSDEVYINKIASVFF